MKTRTKIVTFTLAMLLVGTVAYAATDKKRQAKLEIDESDFVTDEDSLSSELLAAVDEHKQLPRTTAVSSVKINDEADVAKEIEKAVEQ